MCFKRFRRRLALLAATTGALTVMMGAGATAPASAGNCIGVTVEVNGSGPSPCYMTNCAHLGGFKDGTTVGGNTVYIEILVVDPTDPNVFCAI